MGAAARDAIHMLDSDVCTLALADTTSLVPAMKVQIVTGGVCNCFLPFPEW